MINLILKKQLDNFTFVTACFAGSLQQYTYKTVLKLKKGDLVVVESPSGITVVTVHNPKVTVEAEPRWPINWIICKVDIEAYKLHIRLEKDILSRQPVAGAKRL